MKITLNNREEDFDGDKLTVDEMLNLKKFTFKMRIVKINGRLIPKEEYHDTIIINGDDVQMLYLMSGG
jgi:thiazole synthase/sulfur carrier protein